MIQIFEVKPSIRVAACIFVVHVFVIFCVLNFEIAIYVSTGMVLAIFASLYWQISAWLRHHCFLRYESASSCWSISFDKEHWQHYSAISCLYLNDSFMWLILRSSVSAHTSAIIGADSMPTERYLQLRRCIICPGIFN